MKLTIVTLQDYADIVDPFGRPWPLDDVVQGVGPGWEQLVRDLVRRCKLAGWDGHLFQIKEKFGGLRFYIGGATEDVYALIKKAEDDSFTICETCGRPGKERATGWVLTLCWLHYARLVLSRKFPTLWRIRYTLNAFRRNLKKKRKK